MPTRMVSGFRGTTLGPAGAWVASPAGPPGGPAGGNRPPPEATILDTGLSRTIPIHPNDESPRVDTGLSRTIPIHPNDESPCAEKFHRQYLGQNGGRYNKG